MKKLTKKKPWNFRRKPGRLKLNQHPRKLRPPPGHEDKLFKLKFYINKISNTKVKFSLNFKKPKKKRKIKKKNLTKEVWKIFKSQLVNIFVTGSPGQEAKLFNFYFNKPFKISFNSKTKQQSAKGFSFTLILSHNHFFFHKFILINHKKHKKKKKNLTSLDHF